MYSIGEFAKKIGVTIQTLREWDKSGKLKPEYRSKGNHRYYSDNQLNELLQKRSPKNRINVGYVRVSSNYQKEDLERQYELIAEFAKLHNTKVVTMNKDDKKTDEEFVEDILNIIQVFSCKLNGKRSHINKKIIKELEK